MPRIRVALTVLATVALCIGFNVVRYPAVCEMAGMLPGAAPVSDQPSADPLRTSAPATTTSRPSPAEQPAAGGTTEKADKAEKSPKPPAADKNPRPTAPPTASSKPERRSPAGKESKHADAGKSTARTEKTSTAHTAAPAVALAKVESPPAATQATSTPVAAINVNGGGSLSVPLVPLTRPNPDRGVSPSSASVAPPATTPIPALTGNQFARLPSLSGAEAATPAAVQLSSAAPGAFNFYPRTGQ